MSTTTTTLVRKEATRVQIPSSLCFQTRSKRRRKTEKAASPLLLLPRLEDFVEAAVSRAKTTTNIYNQKLFIYYYLYANILLAKKKVSSFSEKNARERLDFFLSSKKKWTRTRPRDQPNAGASRTRRSIRADTAAATRRRAITEQIGRSKRRRRLPL